MERLVLIGALLCTFLAVTICDNPDESLQIAINPGSLPVLSADQVVLEAEDFSQILDAPAAICGTQTTLLPAQKQEAVKVHNQFRSKETATNMLTMVWSDELAAVAQSLANTCKWGHAMLNDCSGKRMGQNLYVEASSRGFPAVNMNKVISSWAAEKKDYNFATGKCTPGKMCGHYTQVVWARTREVGCAAAKCPTMVVSGSTWKNALYTVCDYRRAGNVVGQKVFLPGKSCSNCDSDGTGTKYKCVDKLCSRL